MVELARGVAMETAPDGGELPLRAEEVAAPFMLREAAAAPPRAPPPRFFRVP